MATKVELLQEAKELNLEVDENTTYNELLSLVSAKRKEEATEVEPEKVKNTTQKEAEPFLLMTSTLDHNVSRVLDPKKGLSLFKFGRKTKDGIIPTRVPKEYGQNLFDSYPGKYKIVEVPKEHKADLEGYFAKLIDAQDGIDDQIEEERIKKEIEEKEKRLAELQREGKAKKIVRE